MKSFLKSTICLFLCLIFMLSVVSCNRGNNDEDTDTTNPIVETDDVGDDENTEEALYKPTEKNYDREFVMGIGDTLSYIGVAEDYRLGADSIVSDAMYMRNLFLEEKFGITVIAKVVSASDFETQDMAGTQTCDIYSHTGGYICPFTIKGYFKDLNALSGMNLSASYWGQNMQEEYNILGKLFFVEGDFETRNEDRVPVVTFNEKVWADNGFYTTYGTPYSMVKDGTWTWETMLTMIDGMYQDLDDNQMFSAADRVGLITDGGMPTALLRSAGYKTMTFSDGEIALNVDASNYWNGYYNTLDAVLKKYMDNESIVFHDDFARLGASNYWPDVYAMVRENRALFRYTALSSVLGYGDMASRFGILPVPKYDSDSPYVCYQVGTAAGMTAISRLTSDANQTAEIFEILNYYSRYGANSVYNAYLETYRLSHFCETAEDLEMLEFVFSVRVHDADSGFKISGVQSEITPFVGARKDLSSLYSTFYAKKESAQTKVDDFLVKILELKG